MAALRCPSLTEGTALEYLVRRARLHLFEVNCSWLRVVVTSSGALYPTSRLLGVVWGCVVVVQHLCILPCVRVTVSCRVVSAALYDDRCFIYKAEQMSFSINE